METKDKLLAQLAKDALAKLLQIEIVEVGAGFAKAVTIVSEDMLNSLAITHGAAVFALADMAFAAASNSHGRVAVALNMSISFVKATGIGEKLTATATEDKLTHRTGLYRIVVEDGSGDTVAIAEGLVYRKDELIGEAK